MLYIPIRDDKVFALMGQLKYIGDTEGDISGLYELCCDMNETLLEAVSKSVWLTQEEIENVKTD